MTAHDVLDGILDIIEQERLLFGTYFVLSPTAPTAPAVCGGPRACLLGSAFLAAGKDPGCIYNGAPEDYEEALRGPLGEALDALNHAATVIWPEATEWTEKVDGDAEWVMECEALFEDDASPWYAGPPRGLSGVVFPDERTRARLILLIGGARVHLAKVPA